MQAVRGEFIPLVQFLLDHGACPEQSSYSAIRVAIGKKNLKLVRILIELEEKLETNAKEKWRCGQDIANVLSWVAVECDAREIVKYLMDEQGCVPLIKMGCMLNSFHLCNFYYLTIEQTLECRIVWLKVKKFLVDVAIECAARDIVKYLGRIWTI